MNELLSCVSWPVQVQYSKAGARPIKRGRLKALKLVGLFLIGIVL